MLRFHGSSEQSAILSTIFKRSTILNTHNIRAIRNINAQKIHNVEPTSRTLRFRRAFRNTGTATKSTIPHSKGHHRCARSPRRSPIPVSRPINHSDARWCRISISIRQPIERFSPLYTPGRDNESDFGRTRKRDEWRRRRKNEGTGKEGDLFSPRPETMSKLFEDNVALGAPPHSRCSIASRRSIDQPWHGRDA